MLAGIEHDLRAAEIDAHAVVTLLDAPFLGGFDVPRPQLVDINGDGKLDLFVQERSGELMYFERVGDKFVWRSDRFQDLAIGEWFRFADIDNDGVMDLFSEKLAGYIRVWRNAGTKAEPKFVALGDTVRDNDGLAILFDRQNILNAVDIDCNKKLDLFIGRGLQPSKASVVMNAVDEAKFTAVAKAPPATTSAPDRFVMMYHGTLTSTYGLDIAIEAVVGSGLQMH